MYRYLLILLCLFYGPLYALSETIPTVSVERGQGGPVRFEVGFFDDVTGDKEAEAVLQNDFTLMKSAFTLGQRSGRQWFVLKIVNENASEVRRYLQLSERFYEEVVLYQFSPEGRVLQKSVSGQYVPVSEREIQNPSFTFGMEIPSHSSRILLLSILSTVGTYGEIYLLDAPQLQQATLWEFAIFMLFTGAVMSLSFYSFFIFGVLRERLYLYFGLYTLMFGTLVFVFSGNMSFLLGWESSTRFFALVPAMNLFFILLSRKLLEISTTHVWIEWVLRLLLMVMLTDIALILWDPQESASFVGATLSMVFPILSIYSLYLAFKGDRVAAVYFFAVTLFMLSMSVMIFISLGIIPYYQRTLAFLPLLGSMLELSLIFIALGMRINAIKEERVILKQQLVDFLEEQSTLLHSEVARQTAALNDALKERQVLYKELEHRVKNNFQTILSFLWLQRGHEVQRETQDALSAAAMRVEAMSLLYKRLQPSQFEHSIDLSDYLETLLLNIQRSFGEKKVRLSYTLEALYVETDQAITLGLVLNELLTNAYKHAFTQEGGTIEVTLGEDDDGHCLLRVHDDGALRTEITKGLGWHLIDALLLRLKDAEVHRTVQNGLDILLRFRCT